MSHSKIKAPVIKKCGTCVYFHYHTKEWPCNVCDGSKKDGSQYVPDIKKMSLAEIERAHKHR